MNIHFTFHGASYHAGLSKENNEKVIVLLKDNQLEKQFGNTLPFFIKDKSVEFITNNKCHSDLFALNSTISKAIKEQCLEKL